MERGRFDLLYRKIDLTLTKMRNEISRLTSFTTQAYDQRYIYTEKHCIQFLMHFAHQYYFIYANLVGRSFQLCIAVTVPKKAPQYAAHIFVLTSCSLFKVACPLLESCLNTNDLKTL